MFHAISARLSSVRKFDRLVNSKDINVGEVSTAGGGTQLAIQVPTGEALTLEPLAQQQLLQNWLIPNDHFDRLPRELQAAELTHFSRRQPKELTVRAFDAGNHGQAQGAVRGVVSGKYEKFDGDEVLHVLQTSLPDPENWELAYDGVKRDEMALLIVKPTMHDISARKVGDMVKVGLSIRNSDVGRMALAVEFAAQRLACLNGMLVPVAQVSVKQRHIWIDRQSFVIQLKNAVRNVSEIGEMIVRQLRASHDLLLPTLDPDGDKLQRSVFSVLRKHGLATKTFLDGAREALGKSEEASVFGLVQYLTDRPAKGQDTVGRLGYERVAGDLMQIAG